MGAYRFAMKPLFALLAVMPLAGTAALAETVDPGFSQTQVNIEREAYAERQCPGPNGNWGGHVCYNTGRTTTVSIAGVLPTPIVRSKEKVHIINCKLRKAYSLKTLRGQIAAEYCPQLPALAAAPFLDPRAKF